MMRKSLALIVVLAALMLCFACAGHRQSSSSENSPTPTPADDDDGSPSADDDDDNDDNDDATPNVIEREDLGGKWDCTFPEWCISDYLDFEMKALQYARPITHDELINQIAAVQDGHVQALTDALPAAELRQKILEILNIGFLAEGIDERPLIVTTIERQETAQVVGRRLLFTDPWVGTFEGILLTPKGPGPFPGIVAVHGHRDSDTIYMQDYDGHEYPLLGYAILMLNMRAMGLELFEHVITVNLLENGFALIGMRVYESLLGGKYLRYLPEVAHDRIGLIGHSGGSSTGNLTIRVTDNFKAYVSDCQKTYCEWGTLWEPYHCETVPQLFPYHLLINDFSTSPHPVLKVPYDYTNGMQEIFDFFDSELKP